MDQSIFVQKLRLFGVFIQNAHLREELHWWEKLPQGPTVRYLVNYEAKILEQHNLVFDRVRLEDNLALVD